MTNARKTTRKPGRPPKPAGEKPEQFSVRLPPAMKLGLEVLAADSNLSLSSAVELAVSELLASHKLSNGMSVGDVIAKVENLPPPVALLALYKMSPRFLEFQDRALVEAMLSSQEFVDFLNEPDPGKKTRKSLEAQKFVVENWVAIRTALEGRSWAKKLPKRFSLKELIAPPTPPDDSDDESLFFKKTA